jgi:hypothetical protein
MDIFESKFDTIDYYIGYKNIVCNYFADIDITNIHSNYRNVEICLPDDNLYYISGLSLNIKVFFPKAKERIKIHQI